jgi:hypothetical protein
MVNLLSLSPFFATLASRSQFIENATTLSPVFASLTDAVKHKSFACHSYRKHPGGGHHILHQNLLFLLWSLVCLTYPSRLSPGATWHSLLDTIPFRITFFAYSHT